MPVPSQRRSSTLARFEHDIVRKAHIPPPAQLQNLLDSRALCSRQSDGASSLFSLTVVQQPIEGRAFSAKNASQRKGKAPKLPIDPPPVVEMNSLEPDPHEYFRSSPHILCNVALISADGQENTANGLTGTMASSLHKLKMSDGKEHAYFVFGDLSPTHPGNYYLKFTVWELRTDSQGGQYARVLAIEYSDKFSVNESKGSALTRESTLLTREIASLGVKVRVRKEPSSKRKQPQTTWSSERPQHPFTQPFAPSVSAVSSLPMLPTMLTAPMINQQYGPSEEPIAQHRFSFQQNQMAQQYLYPYAPGYSGSVPELPAMATYYPAMNGANSMLPGGGVNNFNATGYYPGPSMRQGWI